jgi:hypothetical protein
MSKQNNEDTGAFWAAMGFLVFSLGAIGLVAYFVFSLF